MNMKMEGSGTGRIRWLSIALFIIGAVLLVLALIPWKSENVATAGETPTLSFALAGDVEQQKIVDEVVGVFSRVYGCRVDVYCFATEAELREKIIGQFAAGKPFDVFCPDRRTWLALLDSGHLCALDDVVSLRHTEGDDFYSAALASGQADGAQYALPVGVMPYLICYSVDAFEAAGTPSPRDYLDRKQWDADGFVDCLNRYHAAVGRPAMGIERLDQVVYSRSAMAALQEGAVAAMDPEAGKRAFADGGIPMIVGDLSVTRMETVSEWDVVPFPSEGSDFSRSKFSLPMIAAADESQQALARQFISFYVSGIGQKLRLERGECLIPSLNMTFYTSMGNVNFPDHSNYYFFAIENGSPIETME